MVLITKNGFDMLGHPLCLDYRNLLFHAELKDNCPERGDKGKNDN